MPLGFFGGSSSSSKPQPLNGSEEGKDRKEKKDAADKDGRGTVLKLQKTTVTIEKKLAEGGFAIVYLVTDKQNRQYALKRQFINDDQKQVEACKREYQIISSLRGHKNIVCYADHLLVQNKSGVYDYMLLTAYYKTSVLHWMNERLSAGKGLSSSEVLAIFCDVCEAVARLHHSQTPVIHRDLKVENILIDERNRAAPPTYVLCDFGSATTKVLSSNTHPVSFIQEEVEKYTTLSYRSPEMVDVYGGRPIGTKADTWAMGVMLYKLCYFTLPFGESAMAIQNGSFSFPTQPSYPDSIKTIIKCLLDADIERRPSVFQCASLAFEAAGHSNFPVNNVYGVPRPSLSAAVSAFCSGRPIEMTSAILSTVARSHPSSSIESAAIPIKKAEVAVAPLLCSTSPQRSDATTTSVNPRLRPKPTTSIPVVPTIPPSPRLPSARQHPVCPSNSISDPEIVNNGGAVEDLTPEGPPLSCPLSKPTDLGFTDLEEALPRLRSQTDGPFMRGVVHQQPIDSGTYTSQSPIPASSTMSLPSAVVAQSHRRNVSDTSHIIKSAFKPYSQTVSNAVSTSSSNVNEDKLTGSILLDQHHVDNGSSWNPFLAAPFADATRPPIESAEFNTLPRKADLLVRSMNDDSDGASIDSLDPFGAAPFDPPPKVRSEPESSLLCKSRQDYDSVGSSEDLRKRMQLEDDSEVDEQRMSARRRYSYEHIDGVGEDGSSDSRGGPTEGDSTDELSRNEESSHDEDNDSSQQTDVVSDDGGGRPLLEDDGLEDDQDEDLLHNYMTKDDFSRFGHPLSIDARRCTNPFLNTDLTPKISPAGHIVAKQNFQWPATELDFNKAADIFAEDRHDSFNEKPSLPMVAPLDSTYAPATLPRQVTPLSAAPRPPPKPSVPIMMSNPIRPAAMSVTSVAPAVGALIPILPSKPPTVTQMDTAKVYSSKSASDEHMRTVAPSTMTAPEPFVIPSASHMLPDSIGGLKKSSLPNFLEGPKTPKVKKSKDKERDKKKVGYRSSGSEFETDGSEAEMCSSISSDKASASKKKKKSGFVLLGSNPSVAPVDAPAAGIKKTQEKRKVSSSKRGSAPNASFVNSSFQAEDLDSPPQHRTSRL